MCTVNVHRVWVPYVNSGRVWQATGRVFQLNLTSQLVDDMFEFRKLFLKMSYDIDLYLSCWTFVLNELYPFMLPGFAWLVKPKLRVFLFLYTDISASHCIVNDFIVREYNFNVGVSAFLFGYCTYSCIISRILLDKLAHNFLSLMLLIQPSFPLVWVFQWLTFVSCYMQNDEEDMIYIYNAYLHKLTSCFLSHPIARDKVC